MVLFQAEDGIRDIGVTGVQTCALPIFVEGFCVLEVVGARGGGRGVEVRSHGGLRVPAIDHVRAPEAFRDPLRSEERRVGKECRFRWSPHPYKKKQDERFTLSQTITNAV